MRKQAGLSDGQWALPLHTHSIPYQTRGRESLNIYISKKKLENNPSKTITSETKRFKKSTRSSQIFSVSERYSNKLKMKKRLSEKANEEIILKLIAKRSKKKTKKGIEINSQSR